MGMTLSICDDLFQLAHSRVGILRIREQTFRYTLAAAVLGDLILEEVATIDDGHVHPGKAPRAEPVLATDGRIYRGWTPVRESPLTAYLYAALTADNANQRTVRTWLDYIALWAYEAAARRLAVDGKVRQVPFMLRRGTYQEPTDVKYDIAGVRIAHTLGTAAWKKTPRCDVVLAALLSIAGLLDDILVYPDTAGMCRDRLTTLISELPPPLKALVKEAKAALDGKVLAAR